MIAISRAKRLIGDDGVERVYIGHLITMDWTTESPTEGGTYWVYAKHWLHGMTTEHIDIAIRDGKIEIDWPVSGYEWDAPFEVKDITHWFGPIPMPEPPEKGE